MPFQIEGKPGIIKGTSILATTPELCYHLAKKFETITANHAGAAIAGS
jgi:hypothetical protein